MDKGLLLAIWIILSGWALTIAAMLVIKVSVLSIGKGFLEAAIKVISAFLILSMSLLVWYLINRELFTRLKRGGGPGGT